MDDNDQTDIAYDLLQRLSPQQISKNLEVITKYSSESSAELLSSVDQESGRKRCLTTGKTFLTCDYNRDGDSYRSPWSNEFEPPIDDGYKPVGNLRKLEELANDVFDGYKNLYFGNADSSVYLWEKENQDDFAGVILLKKVDSSEQGDENVWDSIHVFEVDTIGRLAQYKVTSTILLRMKLRDSGNVDDVDLGGSITRQTEQKLAFTDMPSHIINIGSIVEDMEIKMRNQLSEIYFGKCRTVINSLRSTENITQRTKELSIQKEILTNLTQ